MSSKTNTHPGKEKLKLLSLSSVNIAVGEYVKHRAREGGGIVLSGRMEPWMS
jgi:hypothetical protein